MPKQRITKEMILEAAFHIAKEQGIANVLVKNVSARLGCSVQPIYSYYKNMDELRQDLVEHTKEYFQAYLTQYIDKTGPIFRQTGACYLRFAKEQRLPLLFYGVSLGGMNYLFYLSIQTVPLGIAVALEFTGPLAVALFSSRRPVDFVWVVLAVLGLWFLLPLGQDVSHVDLTGCALALGAGACWAIYILSGQRAGAEHGPATVAIGSLIAALIFVPIGALQAGEALWHWSVIPLGLAVAILSTALPYSLEMIALTRLPTRTFGTLMSMEPALAAVSGMIFLGETLTPIQLLALGAIIAASMGSTLTVRKESKIKELDIN